MHSLSAPLPFFEADLARATDLSTATVKRNSDLETRLAELELELSVWKQAHATILETAERDKKAHNAQLSSLNKQISGFSFAQVRRRVAVVTPPNDS